MEDGIGWFETTGRKLKSDVIFDGSYWLHSADDTLPVPWQRIQGALWLAGLALLVWQGWVWPGILILVAISGLFQAGVQIYLSKQEEQKAQTVQVNRLAEERANWLPPVCPSCGGPINVETVHWTGSHSANCPYCSANLKPQA